MSGGVPKNAWSNLNELFHWSLVTGTRYQNDGAVEPVVGALLSPFTLPHHSVEGEPSASVVVYSNLYLSYQPQLS
jgi:hypothetical protein